MVGIKVARAGGASAPPSVSPRDSATRSVRRVVRVAAVACGVTLVLGARPGEARRAERSAGGVCAKLFQSAKQLEEAGHLRDAVKTLDECGARRSCGSIARQCQLRYTRLEMEIPSIVPVLKDEAGAPVTEVTLAMDGEPLTGKLDGRPVAVDPGIHEFVFKTDKGVVTTQKIVVVQGQRNRQIDISLQKAEQTTLAALPPPPPDSSVAQRVPQAPPSDDPTPRPTARGGRSAAPYLVGVIGLAGLAGYGLFTYWGKKDDDVLTSSCAPNCDQADIDHVQQMYKVGKISLGVGAGALGIAATWLLIRAVTSGKDEDRASRGGTDKFAVDVQPARAGGMATVSGRF
jgi:hypothetical protein